MDIYLHHAENCNLIITKFLVNFTIKYLEYFYLFQSLILSNSIRTIELQFDDTSTVQNTLFNIKQNILNNL